MAKESKGTEEQAQARAHEREETGQELSPGDALSALAASGAGLPTDPVSATSRLHNARLFPAQRQAAAARIGRLKGNRFLQRSLVQSKLQSDITASRDVSDSPAEPPSVQGGHGYIGGDLVVQRQPSRRRRQQLNVDPATIERNLDGLTTETLIYLYIESYLEGERVTAHPGTPRFFTRSRCRENRSLIAQRILQRLEHDFANDPPRWYRHQASAHSQGAGSPEAIQRLDRLFLQSQGGRPLPEGRPLLANEIDELSLSGILQLEEALREIHRTVVRPSFFQSAFPDRQEAAQYIAALCAFRETILYQRSGSAGTIPRTLRVEGRPQTRVAERALQAWNRLSADQRTALNLRSRDFAGTKLNNEIRSLALTTLREVGIPNISLDEVRREVEQ